MELIQLVLNFHDITALQAAGLRVPQPATIQCPTGTVPIAGDVFQHAGMHYPDGEPAAFRVVSRAHRFGGEHIQRIQLNLELVVLHQP